MRPPIKASSLVALYHNIKTHTALSKEYGVSLSALGKWVRLHSEIKAEDGDIIAAKQIKELQKRCQPEEDIRLTTPVVNFS